MAQWCSSLENLDRYGTTYILTAQRILSHHRRRRKPNRDLWKKVRCPRSRSQQQKQKLLQSTHRMRPKTATTTRSVQQPEYQGETVIAVRVDTHEESHQNEEEDIVVAPSANDSSADNNTNQRRRADPPDDPPE